MLIGVYDASLCRPVSEVLGRLGAEHVMVVHSDDGLDEISIATSTQVAEFKDGKISEYRIRPSDFGMAEQSLEGLEVDDADGSLALIRSALTGVGDSRTAKAADIIAFNAGAAIYVAGLAASTVEGVKIAQSTIASGKAWKKLQQLATLTHRFVS